MQRTYPACDVLMVEDLPAEAALALLVVNGVVVISLDAKVSDSPTCLSVFHTT